MTQPYRLHYAPDNASLCVRIALTEIGAPFETVLVDRAKTAQKSPAYLALNPNGLIPVLETPNGAMFETAAILLWLSEHHGALAPAPGDPARSHCLQWLFWISNTLHPTQRMLFYPSQFTTGDPNALTTRHRLMAHFDILESAQTTPWLDDGTASINACYLAPMLRWCALYGGDSSWFDLTRWPRLHAFARHCDTRPAFAAAAQSEGLGPTPFSAPHSPTPPEGSAT